MIEWSSAASPAKARLTVLDATSVVVEIDSNGDGAYDNPAPQPVAWSDLVPG